MRHVYETTYEAVNGDGIVVGSLELRVHYRYGTGRPDDQPELEITDIYEEAYDPAHRLYWSRCQPHVAETFENYVLDKHFDDMVENAC